MKENPLPYVKDRLMIVDWASLSYHQLHGLLGKKDSAQVLDIDTPEKELEIWRHGMLRKMTQYIKMFNPKEVVLTLEGNDIWRNDVVKDYYNENTMVYYDKNNYYAKFDNFIYMFTKNDDGSIAHQKLDLLDAEKILPNNGKKLKDMPDRIQILFWDTVLPKYKGTRSSQPWNFIIDKKVWRNYKETFASEIAEIFRAHVIGLPEAEGDDVIYVSAKYLGKDFNSVVIVTCDSDLNQMLIEKNVKIFNHRKDEMVVCSSPSDYIEVKTLCGDKSDNINGMARPNKKTQLGEAGAIKLYESVGNIYALAVEEGWENQYQRNQTLIKLSFIPTHIQRQLCNQIDKSKPQLCDFEKLNDMGYNKKIISEISRMKDLGFYTVNSLAYVNAHPDMFNPDIFSTPDVEDEPMAIFGDINAFKSPIGSIF